MTPPAYLQAGLSASLRAVSRIPRAERCASRHATRGSGSPTRCRRNPRVRRTISRAGCAAAAAVLLAATSSYADQPTPLPCPGWPDPAVASLADSLFPLDDGQPSRGSMDPGQVAPVAAPESRAGAAGGSGIPGVRILDEYLAARIQQLEERSVRFRAAMALVHRSRVPVIIGTPHQVRHVVGLPLAEYDEHVGDLVVVRCEPASLRIRLMVVRVNLGRLRASARWHMLLGPRRARRWLDSTTETVLIHEIWGHLIPILEAGDFAGHCPDPAPAQADAEACAMQRENELRRDLGLRPRERYALRLTGS